MAMLSSQRVYHFDSYWFIDSRSFWQFLVESDAIGNHSKSFQLKDLSQSSDNRTRLVPASSTPTCSSAGGPKEDLAWALDSTGNSWMVQPEPAARWDGCSPGSPIKSPGGRGALARIATQDFCDATLPPLVREPGIMGSTKRGTRGVYNQHGGIMGSTKLQKQHRSWARIVFSHSGHIVD